MWYEGAALTNKRFLHTDERGSVIAVTDASGAAIGINTYDEYDIPKPSVALATNISGRFSYTGQIWIPELGLYYYKARFYSPTLGRFMQTDPIGYADGINWYNYVDGDPVNKVDPSGLRRLTEGESQMARNLHLNLGSYSIYRFPNWVMDIGGASATVYPWELDVASRNYRTDFSAGNLKDRELFYHELYHIFEFRNGIKSWSSMAYEQTTGTADYKWNSALSWRSQNFEARAEAFGQCAGAGNGCARLEGQSIRGGDSTLSFKDGVFTMSTMRTGSRIPETVNFSPPKSR